jgi:hypothetical protein
VGVCKCGFCNVWTCVCMGSIMCGCVCSDKCVGVVVICVLVFTAFLYCLFYVYLFLFLTSVGLLPLCENSIAVNNNNNNNNNNGSHNLLYKF